MELPLAEEDLWLCQGSLSWIGEKSQSSANVVCTIQLLPLAQMVRSAKAALLINPETLGKLFKSTLNNRLHRNLDCVIDKSSRGAKLKRAFEELPQSVRTLEANLVKRSPNA